MIRLLLGFGLPKWASKLIGYVAIPLIIGGLIYFAVTAYGGERYDAGVADEMTAQAERERQAQLSQLARERDATARLEQDRRADDRAAAGRKMEIDDATRDVPDQVPSARQRSRACLSLRAEAKAAGRPEPTC